MSEVVLSVEDRIAITELIAMHGHLVDSGRLDRMVELFTDDVVYDVSAFGGDPLIGPEAIRDAGWALGDRNPVGHHVTNTVITEATGDTVAVLSKAIGIMADGTCGSLTYEDVVVRTGAGWRISHRRIIPHRKPLGR